MSRSIGAGNFRLWDLKPGLIEVMDDMKRHIDKHANDAEGPLETNPWRRHEYMSDV